MLNWTLVVHGEPAGPSSCHRRFKGASARFGISEELLDISDDSDDPDGGIDLGLEEEPGSLLDYLRVRRENVMRCLISIGAPYSTYVSIPSQILNLILD